MANDSKSNFKQYIQETINIVDDLIECTDKSSSQMTQLRINKWNLERMLDAVNKFEKIGAQIRKTKKTKTK